MTDDDQINETELAIKRINRQRKRQGYFLIFLAIIMAGLVAAGIYLYSDNTAIRAVSKDRDERIGSLEKALDAQRQQFLDCKDQPPTAQGCAKPVAPPSGAIPGPQGPQGIQGLQGIAGLQGATGARGPRGFRGFTGASGADGESVVGPAGTDGQDGATGPAGPQGPQGEQGQQGPMGPAGPNCPDGYTGQEFQVENGESPANDDTRTIYACVPDE